MESCRFTRVATFLLAFLVLASPAAAQSTGRSARLLDQPEAVLILPSVNASVLDIGARRALAGIDSEQARFGLESRPRMSTTSRAAMKWGIAIGVIAGAVAAGAAAARYGGNEGGAFCAPCFVSWSAISIPVGAGVGAAIGFAIDEARQ